MITVIFDTETDGLITNSMMPSNARPRIMEFYGRKIDVKFDPKSGFSFTELGVMHQLFSIGRQVKEEVIKITGITDRDLVDKPVFSVAGPSVIAFLQDAERVVAHNLSYDTAVVEYECERFGMAKPVWPEKLCTVEATEHFKGHRLKLVDLYAYLFGEPFSGAHRAKTDVDALTECYCEIIKRGEL